MTDNISLTTLQQTQQTGSAGDYDYLTLDIAALSENKKINRYGYEVGVIRLLVPANTLSEVLRKFTLYPIPNTKEWLRGLVNLRGNLIPVYDVSMLFGMSDAPANYDSLLILDKGAEAVGILIDKLPVVCDLDNWQLLTDSVSDIPAIEQFISESYKKDDIIWSCFDHREYFRSIRNDVAS
ncbi:MAG: chemotaxis protein CheW [Gammaproteobacteria bacterium]|jgi:twitching motility protein PilI|nr:chemotaxis protein CheW [Gammaproteobacteria bacterium]